MYKYWLLFVPLFMLSSIGSCSDEPDDDWSGRTERNNDGEKYEANGLVYYLVSNQGLSKAGWEYDDVSYVISGQITEQELKNMINSIAEGVA